MANKRLFFILSLVLTLALAACAGPPAELTPTATSTPLPPTFTPLPTNTPTITLTPSLTPTQVFDGNIEKGDYFIYMLNRDKKLFFFDPETNTHIPILPDWEIGTYAISMNDQLVISSLRDGNSEIYLLEYPFWKNEPINITNTPDTHEYPHSWSPDGNHLLFYTSQTDALHLTIWDGIQFTHIFQFEDETHMGYSEYDWSPDGKFAFTIWSNNQISEDNTNNYIPQDLYIWDGNIHHMAVNFSQNPLEDDRSPKWNSQGQLAYQSDYDTIIFWDGTFFSDGTPDRSTITEIAPEMLIYTSFPSWRADDTLVFYLDGILQVWDGKSISPLILPNIEIEKYQYASWGSKGNFLLDYSVFDIHNNLVLELEGTRIRVWSPEDQLAFCKYNFDTHLLTIYIWNGSEIIEVITNSQYMRGKWRNGNTTYCSNG